MPRPTTKQDLITAANDQFIKMWKLFDAMSEAEQNAAFNFGDTYNGKEAHWNRDENLRDVFGHLHEWHQLLLNWVRSNKSGVATPFLLAPYNWKSYGQMNVEFWEKHRATPLSAAIDMVKASHAEVMSLLEPLTNEELFTKGALPWTGTSTLGSYCVSATASHYEWAMKKMKAHRKTYAAE